jgi:uncharacterized membrane protein YdjX (TVP38/TMEM64 family)
MVSSSWKKWKWILFLFILAGIAFLIIYQYNSQLWNQIAKTYDLLHDRQQLKAVIRSFGPYSPLAYILLQILQVVIAPVPGGAVEFLGGYLFGAKAGFIYSMIGLILGSWLAFSLARIFEKIAVEKFVSEQTRKKFDYLVEHEGAILSFILFLVPGFPKDALCYILGLTPMHLGIFLIISTVGRIPGTLMAILQGAKAFEHEYYTFGMLLGVSALAILVFYIYHEEIHNLIKKMKEGKKESLGEENDTGQKGR